MAHRRIVLKGPIMPEKPKEPERPFALHPPVLPGERRPKRWLREAVREGILQSPFEFDPSLGPATMREFFHEAGIRIDKDFVMCKGCKDITDFDADFLHKTIKCCGCNRIVTFELFEQEHK